MCSAFMYRDCPSLPKTLPIVLKNIADGNGNRCPSMFRALPIILENNEQRYSIRSRNYKNTIFRYFSFKINAY